MAGQMRPLNARATEILSLAVRVAPHCGGVITAAQARAWGARDGDIRELMARGDLCRIRRGVYATAAVYAVAMKDAEARHRLETAAALACMTTKAVASHTSAVRLLGLPTPSFVGNLVHLTRRPPSSPNDVRGTDLHVCEDDDSDLVIVDGIPVLGGARVVIDAAAVLSSPDALAVADAALRQGICTRAEMVDLISEKSGNPGTAITATIIRRADPAAESWFESISRWWLLESDLPDLVLQQEFLDDGKVRARVDLYEPLSRTVGEADGLGKYADRADLVAERRREDWLRSAYGVEFVRWTPSEMRSRKGRAAVVERWRAAIDRGSRRPYRSTG